MKNVLVNYIPSQKYKPSTGDLLSWILLPLCEPCCPMNWSSYRLIGFLIQCKIMQFRIVKGNDEVECLTDRFKCGSVITHFSHKDVNFRASIEEASYNLSELIICQFWSQFTHTFARGDNKRQSIIVLMMMMIIPICTELRNCQPTKCSWFSKVKPYFLEHFGCWI